MVRTNPRVHGHATGSRLRLAEYQRRADIGGTTVNMPQPPPPNAPKNNTPDRTIVVQLIDRGAGQDPGLKINQEDATWDNLQGRLADIYKTRAEKVMFVKGDDPIPFADVANVIDIAHAAGVDKVGLITAKIEAGG